MLTANVHACETRYTTSASLSAGTGRVTRTAVRHCSRTCQALPAATNVTQSGVGDDLARLARCAAAVGPVDRGTSRCAGGTLEVSFCMDGEEVSRREQRPATMGVDLVLLVVVQREWR